MEQVTRLGHSPRVSVCAQEGVLKHVQRMIWESRRIEYPSHNITAICPIIKDTGYTLSSS